MWKGDCIFFYYTTFFAACQGEVNILCLDNPDSLCYTYNIVLLPHTSIRQAMEKVFEKVLGKVERSRRGGDHFSLKRGLRPSWFKGE